MSEDRTHKRLQMLDKAIAAGSQDPFIFYARALELRGQGALQAALDALTDVEARFPDYVPTFLMAGQIALELDQTSHANNVWERGLAAATRAGDEHAKSELQQALATLGYRE